MRKRLYQHMLQHLRDFIELQAFGVCSYLGDKLEVRTSRIRMFFVYTSFLTLGSPVLIYLAMAWLLNVKHYIQRKRRNPLWDF